MATAGNAVPRGIERARMRFPQSEDVHVLLDAALDAALDITGADMGNIQLLEPGDGILKIAVSRGFSARFLEFFGSVAAQTNSACAAALSNRMRIVVDDVTTSYLFVATPALDVMLAANARAVHSTPLLSRSSRLMGVLSTHWRHPLDGMPYDPASLDVLAGRIADRLQEIERRQAAEDANIRGSAS